VAKVPQNYINNNEIIVYADAAIFSRDAILKCLYWYGDKFHATVNLEEEQYFRVLLVAAAAHPMDASDLELYLQKLERDIVDFSLRDIVTKETRNVRDLLIAKAFSNGEFDELPPGEISDPVGYHTSL
jgi:His-Xaa-Ser system protein HxsD